MHWNFTPLGSTIWYSLDTVINFVKYQHSQHCWGNSIHELWVNSAIADDKYVVHTYPEMCVMSSMVWIQRNTAECCKHITHHDIMTGTVVLVLQCTIHHAKALSGYELVLVAHPQLDGKYTYTCLNLQGCRKHLYKLQPNMCYREHEYHWRLIWWYVPQIGHQKRIWHLENNHSDNAIVRNFP